MKKSYKIGLVAVGLLCAVIIGYYTLQTPQQSRAARPIVADSTRTTRSTSSLARPSLIASTPAPLEATPAATAVPAAVPSPGAMGVGPWQSAPASPAASTPVPPAPNSFPTPSQPARPAASPAPMTPIFAPATQPAAPRTSVLGVAPATRPSITAAGQRPGVTTASAAAPQPGRTYTIKANDTFASIAVALFGSAEYADDIAHENPMVDPRKLKIGQVIRLPLAAMSGLPQPTVAAAEAAGPTYVTRGSDTLWSIAVQFYGDGTQWQRIYRENRDRIGPNPDSLEEGLKLRIPPKEVTATR